MEQNARAALQVAAYAREHASGRIVLSGPSVQLRGEQGIQMFYLGVTAPCFACTLAPNKRTRYPVS